MRHYAVALSLALAATTAACVGGDLDGPSADREAVFDAQLWGVMTRTICGPAIWFPVLPDGIGELGESRSVLPLTLFDGPPVLGAPSPQIFIGLIGQVADTGVCSVHRPGTGLRPAGRELYGHYLTHPDRGGTLRFDLSKGLVHIRTLSPWIRGEFLLKAKTAVSYPALVAPRDSAVCTQTESELRIIGSFSALPARSMR